MSKYYPVEVSRAILQEYMDLTVKPKTVENSQKIIARKQEIRAHVFTEAFSAFAAEFAPKQPEMEIVK